MLNLLISILIYLGLLAAPEDYHQLSTQEQLQYQQNIIIEDYTQF